MGWIGYSVTVQSDAKPPYQGWPEVPIPDISQVLKILLAPYFRRNLPSQNYKPLRRTYMLQIAKIGTAFAFTLCLIAGIQPANAQSIQNTPQNEAMINGGIILNQLQLNDQQQEYFDKVVGAGAYFEYDSYGKLIVNADDFTLHQLGFNVDEINFLRTSLQNTNFADNGNFGQSGLHNVEVPMLHVDGNTLYISNQDLKNGVAAGIATAAAIGPAALQAALVALASMFGGPIGTAIGLVLVVLGAPGMVELAGRIVWAIGTGQGIYVKPVASYPPYEIGYW